MEQTRVEVVGSFSVTGRKGKAVHAQLLSGTLEEYDPPIQMISEIAEDIWRVNVMIMFGSPHDFVAREQAWKRGDRLLWFVPVGELRDLLDGETFALLPDGSVCVSD